MTSLFRSLYSGKRVFVTGHTGFKGSWLSLWLSRMGATVCGYSLMPVTSPNHHGLLDLSIKSIISDVRDREALLRSMRDFAPDIVFHLAAQPLVRYSYRAPVETFETNILGTMNVLEAVRQCQSVKAAVCITTDKVYENAEWVWGYRETEPLGGHDPYSASKACAEIVISSYRSSFLNPARYGTDHGTLIASVRAGNVIGGGDWSEDRLVPDIAKAAGEGRKVIVRNPAAIRPWQHVLDCLSGYLMTGQKLLEGRPEFAEAWNFGPSEESEMEVGEVLAGLKRNWPAIEYEIKVDPNQVHEANFLKLDCSKARFKLKWKPVWGIDQALAKTAQWYRAFYANQSVCSEMQLQEYLQEGAQKGVVWASGS